MVRLPRYEVNNIDYKLKYNGPFYSQKYNIKPNRERLINKGELIINFGSARLVHIFGN